MRIAICLILGSSLVAGPLSAEDAGSIVVTATRRPAPLIEVAQSVTLLDRATLDRRQTIAVADALRLVPGVSVARNGGVGAVATLFIRGAESDQTLALIDGVRVNDPASPGGGFNFGPLLLGGIERIEVVRGSQSLLWGSQAIGGVVHLMTAEPEEAATAQLRVEGGTRATANLVARLAGRTGPLAMSLGAGWFRTDGISAFSEARGGRERDGFENWGLTGRLEVEVAPAVDLDLRGFWADSRSGIDGFPPPAFALADTPETSRSRQFAGHAGLRVALANGRWRNRIAATLSALDRENRDPSSRPPVTFDGLGRNERFEYQADVQFSDRLGLVAGYEHETSRLRTQSFGGPVSRARAKLDGVFGELTARPLDGLVLRGGLRYDGHSAFGSNLVLASSASFSPDGGRTTLRASWGEGFKVPSLFQLFSDFGNEALRPERSDSMDVGGSVTLVEGFTLSATWFQRRVRDQIVFISCFGNPAPICTGRPFGTYDNLARTKADGVEVELAMRPTDRLELQAGYARVDAVDRITGRDLPRRPRDSLFATLDWQAPSGLSLGATGTVSGARYDDAANSRRLAGHTLVDLRAAMALGHGMELFGRVENLFDERYETAFLYGQPGRTGLVGLRWNR